MWRLHQHLGYIYWQRHEFEKAGQVYAAGAKLPDAPEWMAEMSARVTAEGGSRRAAREMYQHLYDEAKDEQLKQMLARRLMQVDSFAERDLIRKVLSEYSTKFGRCAASWKDVTPALRAVRLRVDAQGAPKLVESDVFQPMTRLVIRAEEMMNALLLVGTPANLDVVTSW